MNPPESRRESLAYLESLQRSILGSCGANPAALRMRFRQANVFNADDIQYAIRFPLTAEEAEQLEGQGGQFTGFEDAATRRILWSLGNRGRVAFGSIGRPLPDDIVLGTLPLGAANACIFSGPRGGAIIAINSGLFSYLAAIAELVMSCTIPGSHEGQTYCSFPEPGQVEAILDRREEISDRFVDLLRNYRLVGSCDGQGGYLAEDDARGTLPYTTLLIQTGCAFVMFHEMSHLLLGHLLPAADEGPDAQDVMPKSWLKEHLCDALSCSAVLSYNLRYAESDLESAFLGIGIFFFAMELLDRLAGAGESPTHPPTRRRLAVLLDRLREEAGGRFGGTTILQVAGVFEALWARNEQRLRDELADPKPPEWYSAPLILLNPAVADFIPAQLRSCLETQDLIDELLPAGRLVD